MSRFTPLSELPQAFDDETRLAWQFEPSMHLDQEKVGVNVARTLRAAQMAGFGNVLVKNYFGGQSGHSVEGQAITGINPDGSATGSVVSSVTRAETEKTSQYYDDGCPLGQFCGCIAPTYRWPTAVIEINRNELASRITDHIQRGHHQEKAWAYEINRSLKRGILAQGGGKFKQDYNSSGQEKIWTWLVGSEIASIPLHQSPTIAGIYTAMQAFVTAIEAIHHNRKFGRTLIERKRLSLFPFQAQPDRYAASAAMLSIGRLAGTVKQK